MAADSKMEEEISPGSLTITRHDGADKRMSRSWDPRLDPPPGRFRLSPHLSPVFSVRDGYCRGGGKSRTRIGRNRLIWTRSGIDERRRANHIFIVAGRFQPLRIMISQVSKTAGRRHPVLLLDASDPKSYKLPRPRHLTWLLDVQRGCWRKRGRP